MIQSNPYIIRTVENSKSSEYFVNEKSSEGYRLVNVATDFSCSDFNYYTVAMECVIKHKD